MEEDFNWPVEKAQWAGQAHPSGKAFDHDRHELYVEHGEIRHDAHGHLEERRMARPHGGKRRVPDVVVAAQVHEDPQRHEGVSEGGGEQGGAGQRLEAMTVEDVGDGGGREAASGESHAGGHIDGDPQSPRETVVEVGDRAEPGAETNKGEPRTHGHQQHEHAHSRRVQSSVERGRFGAGHRCAPSEDPSPVASG